MENGKNVENKVISEKFRKFRLILKVSFRKRCLIPKHPCELSMLPYHQLLHCRKYVYQGESQTLLQLQSLPESWLPFAVSGEGNGNNTRQGLTAVGKQGCVTTRFPSHFLEDTFGKKSKPEFQQGPQGSPGKGRMSGRKEFANCDKESATAIPRKEACISWSLMDTMSSILSSMELFPRNCA